MIKKIAHSFISYLLFLLSVNNAGSSRPEIEIPLTFIMNDIRCEAASEHSYLQIDLVPTISGFTNDHFFPLHTVF